MSWQQQQQQQNFGAGQQPPPVYQMPYPHNYQQQPQQGYNANAPPPPSPTTNDSPFAKNDDEFLLGFEFTDKTIRRGFIRKVYSILMVQLLVTVSFIALFMYNDGMKLWSQRNPGVFIGSMVLTFVMLLALACCETVRRRAPQNFICLAIFTLAEGFVLGSFSSHYDQSSVILAVGMTTVVCLALTLFSFQTKYDFTAHGGILFVCCVVLFLFGFVAIFLRSVFPIVNLIYATLGVLLFSVYLVYDTQLMLGGKHKYSISPEEYVFASLNLYLDIVNIFIYILSIIGTRD